jgi:carboxymethylenebutenolidase
VAIAGERTFSRRSTLDKTNAQQRTTRGTGYQTDGFGSFSTGRLSRRPRDRAEGGGGSDSGNLRRQPPHSRDLRPVRRQWLYRHRAFDRIEPNFQSGYSPDEIAVARKFVANPDWTAMLRDTQAAIDAVKDVGPVGIIGFCLGGSVAYAAATKLSGLSAAIGYYGGAVVRFADDKPKVPTQLHFGEKDTGIPLADVETIRAKRPDVEIFIYPGAQHGFGCDERASYDKPSADLAKQRSLDFFAGHLKK